MSWGGGGGPGACDKRLRAGQAEFAGSGGIGQCRSKHFPLDVGFLLCLAATEGCLNFSQRQIFIHQSMQCSMGPACEREVRGVLRCVHPHYACRVWGDRLGSWWALGGRDSIARSSTAGTS